MAMRDSWVVELLDRNDRLKGARLQCSGGSLDWSIFKSVPGSGSITLTQSPLDQIDWLTDRIRIAHVNGNRRTPMGVWLLSMPGWETAETTTTTTIALSDKCEVLNSPIGEWYTAPAGANVIATVVGIIQSRGETRIAATDSSQTLPGPRSWNPTEGTTWLNVVNDLLGMINYSSLWADMEGNLRLDPYVVPAQRPVVAAYGDSLGDLKLKPQWSDSAELFSLPTGVRVIVEGDEIAPGFIGRADLPDEHPLSAVSRGRDLLRVETGDATTQQVAHDMAARILADSVQVVRSQQITHPIDETQVNDVVHIRPTDITASIVERSVDMGIGAVVSDRVRLIYTGGELPWPLAP